MITIIKKIGKSEIGKLKIGKNRKIGKVQNQNISKSGPNHRANEFIKRIQYFSYYVLCKWQKQSPSNSSQVLS